jgi:predicted lipoprotein with Yx(FWY)xxD motif
MRAGIGDQVTYAGHPLYLFDQSPGQLNGEGWDEPTLPPWHGVWWTVAPSGNALPWPDTLTTTTIDNKSVLAALMLTGIGWEPFPLYAYSTDSASQSTCSGSCAAAWPPLLVQGKPSVMGTLSESSFGTITLPDGTLQLKYKHKPLYLYSLEGIAPQGSTYVTTGSGNGVHSGSGTFRLITP